MNYLIALKIHYLMFSSFILVANLAFAQMPGNPDTTLQYFRNSTIAAQSQYFSRQKGTNLVFEYEVKNEGKAEIADDEWVMRLMWEVPAKVKMFKLTDEQLKSAHANYLIGCFCLGRGYYEIEDGEISGKCLKQGTWQVDGSITFTSSDGQKHDVIFSGKFKTAAVKVQE